MYPYKEETEKNGMTASKERGIPPVGQ